MSLALLFERFDMFQSCQVKLLSNMAEYSESFMQHLDIPEVDVEVSGESPAEPNLLKSNHLQGLKSNLLSQVIVLPLPPPVKGG
jgi:hypothetical protein